MFVCATPVLMNLSLLLFGFITYKQSSALQYSSVCLCDFVCVLFLSLSLSLAPSPFLTNNLPLRPKLVVDEREPAKLLLVDAPDDVVRHRR